MSTTTANFDWPIPQTTDAVQIPQDISALGTAIDTTLQSILTAYLTPVDDSDAGDPAAGFTDQGSYVRTTLNGRDVFFKLFVKNTSALPVSGGDLSDVQIYTLDPPYCPTDTVNATMGTGHVTGECTLDSSGVVLIRSASDSIAANSSIRVTFKYTKAA